MQSKDIIQVLKNSDAKTFIREHLNDNLAHLSLKYSGKTTFNITVCLQLMSIYKKAKVKLPLYAQNLLALDKRSYEQCTSEKVAQYKATFIQGINLLDLTAGLGVDSFYFSQSFKSVISVDHNANLNYLAQYNLQCLGVKNITRELGQASEFLTKRYSWIYIDPDRRVESKRKITLDSLSPNVINLIPKLNHCTDKVYIKLSPLFDIAEVWKKFQHAQDVHIISEKGEVKELGVVLSFIKKDKQCIKLKDVTSGFSFCADRNTSFNTKSGKSSDNKHLIIPNSLLTKSRLAEVYLKDEVVKKHPDLPYFYCNNLMGIEGLREFEIISTTSLAVKHIRNLIKNNKVEKLNIIVKGLKEKPQEWHNKLKTKDGGNYYLFLTKGKIKEALLCKLIS